MDIPKKHLQGLAFLADDSDAGDQFLQKYNLSQSSSPSLAAFRAFVQKVFQSSISQAHKHTFSSGGSSNSSNNNDNDNDNGSDGNGDACEKMCVASLLCLILEASKQDAVTEEIRSILDDNSVSDERQQCFLQAYTRYLPFIRAHLQQTTFSFPNIVDVEWRLDFDLKSNLLEQKREPSYLITITTCNATATSARTPSPSLNTAHPTAQTNTDTSTAAVGDSGRASVPVYSVEKVSFVCSVQELQDLVATLKDACNTVKNQF